MRNNDENDPYSLCIVNSQISIQYSYNQESANQLSVTERAILNLSFKISMLPSSI